MRLFLAALGLFLLSPLRASAEASPQESPAAVAPSSNPNLVCVDFSNQEIRAILRSVADKFELNIVIPDDLVGRTSVKLREVSWRQVYREILTPVGYTFVEDENIVRIVSRERLGEGNADAHKKTAFPGFSYGLTLPVLTYLVLVPIGVIQFFLFIAVLRDRMETRSQFIPQWLWAVLVLGGGIVPLLAYWLMHHSTLAKASTGDSMQPQS